MKIKKNRATTLKVGRQIRQMNKKTAGGATGAVLGATVAGPLGAVVGGAVGALVGSIAEDSARSGKRSGIKARSTRSRRRISAKVSLPSTRKIMTRVSRMKKSVLAHARKKPRRSLGRTRRRTARSKSSRRRG